MNIRYPHILQLRGVASLLSCLYIIGFGVYALPAHAIAQSNREQTTSTNSSPFQASAKPALHKDFGKLPLCFIENNGQLDEKVRYYEKGRGRATYFTNAGVYVSLTKSQNPQSETVGLIPLGANKHPGIFAEAPQEGRVNYFIGNNPAKWKSGIPAYKSVLYKGIYEDIDMRFYGNNEHLEYDIIVNSGASPSRVQLSYRGVEGLRVTEEGDLEICLKDGRLIQKRQYVYQEIEGKRIEREGRFRVFSSGFGAKDQKFRTCDERSQTIRNSILETRNSKLSTLYSTLAPRHSSFVYGFTVASYDKSYPLVIDPVLEYSTYLRGSGYDVGNGIAVDDSGNVYITGETESSDFPMANAIYESYRGGTYDVFVTKLNASGSARVYSTYLGGSGSDEASSIAVDTSGNVYVTGYTQSTDFPTANAIYGTSSGNMDVFISKLNASGSVLDYSTYLGGTNEDRGDGIAVDTSGNAYVTGWTFSGNFPKANAIYKSRMGTNDVFITKINASGSALDYSTFLGGNSYDYGRDIAVDASGNAYVTGYTESTDFPMSNAIYESYGEGYDVFVTKLNASGSALGYSTYLGGSSYDHGYGIAVDASGSVYATGYTYSTDFPQANAIYGSNSGGYDVFVTKISDIPCELKSVKVSSGVVKLKIGESKEVTVTLAGDNDCPIEGEQVTAKTTTTGRKFIKITPTSKNTDSNGDAVFTIKAKNTTGRAKVTFRSGSKKISMIVRV